MKDSFDCSSYFTDNTTNAAVSSPQGHDSTGACVERVQGTRQPVADRQQATQPAVNPRRVAQPVASMQQNSQHKCFHCGVPGHVKRVCRLKSRPVICHSCHETGHKKKYCPQNGSVSGYFVLPKVNLCQNNTVNPIGALHKKKSRFSNNIAHSNFVGCMPTSAVINTVRSFGGFPFPPPGWHSF